MEDDKIKAIRKTKNSTWLDEMGLRYGLLRIGSESTNDYRRRLLKHVRNFPKSTEKGFIEGLARQVAVPEHRMFRIDLVEDVDGFTLAADPRLEIDSVFLRIWSDYRNSQDNPDLEIDVVNKEGAYFLKDVYNAINALDFVKIEIDDKKLLDTGWEYWHSKYLRYGNTDRHIINAPLNRSKLNELAHSHIRETWFSSGIVFENDISLEAFHYENASEGDYAVDKRNGIIFSYYPADGDLNYSYRQFPYTIRWQPIRSFPLNDKSLDHITKDYLINPEGQNERLLLNSYGAKIADQILAIHPLQWGE